jgi:hypothetical protein
MVDRREVERLVGEVIVSEESLTELADVDVAPR